MSKISYFAALLLALFTTMHRAEAQNPDSYYEEIPRTFYGGLLAGVNFTQVDGDRYAGYHKIGANVGGIMYAQLMEHLAASIEILFSQKGSRAHFAQESTNQTFYINKYNIRLNYAEVPLQLNYFDRRKSHFGAGFSLSRLISVNENAETNPVTIQDFTKYPFRKMDYNFIAGGSLHLWQGLFLNVRFQYSLRSIRAKENIPPEFAGRIQQFNNVWTVRMMYLF